MYLGQHHLLIQTKLLDKAYVKIKLWQQEELVGRVKIVTQDISRVIRFPATKKGIEPIHEGILPLTHKIAKGHYKIQFRKQIVFNQEWYTYKIWTQELSIQTKQVINPKQMLKRKSRITNRIIDSRLLRTRSELYANKDFIDTHIL